jgi:nucleoid-associated protein YgaU
MGDAVVRPDPRRDAKPSATADLRQAAGLIEGGPAPREAVPATMAALVGPTDGPAPTSPMPALPAATTPGGAEADGEPGAPPASEVAHPERPEPRVHVVHNGDTLGRLAKRYLGDEGRALEIFDLNRDVLSNPHLLPIGVELRIPADRPLDGDDAPTVDRSADGSAAE